MNTELNLSNTDYSNCFGNGESIDYVPGGLKLPLVQGKPYRGEMSKLYWYSCLEHFVFGNANYIYGLTIYDEGIYLNWFITAKSQFYGFAVYGNNIYVQDGPVLFQYNISKIASDGKSPLERELTAPDAAISLLTQQSAKDADYLAINAPAFSAPIVKPPQDVTVGPKENLVYVLADTGSIYASNASLSYIVTGCHNRPDSLRLGLQQDGNNTALYYLSGSQVIAIDGNADNLQGAPYIPPNGISAVDWMEITTQSSDLQPRLTSFRNVLGLNVVFTKLSDSPHRFGLCMGNPQKNASIFMMTELDQNFSQIDPTGVPQGRPTMTKTASIVITNGKSLSGVFLSPPYIAQRGTNLFYIYGLFADKQGDITIKKIRLPDKKDSPDLTAIWAKAWGDIYLVILNAKVMKALNILNTANSDLIIAENFVCNEMCCDQFFPGCNEMGHQHCPYLPDVNGARIARDNAQISYNNILNQYHTDKSTVDILTLNINPTTTNYLIASLAWEILKSVYQSSVCRKIIGI